MPQGSFEVIFHSIKPEPVLDLVMKTASAAEAAPAVEETVSSAPTAAPAPAAVETAPAPAQ